MLQRTHVTRALREADRIFKPAQPKTTEYARMQKAFHANRERLKSERLAREGVADERARKPKTSS